MSCINFPRLGLNEPSAQGASIGACFGMVGTRGSDLLLPGLFSRFDSTSTERRIYKEAVVRGHSFVQCVHGKSRRVVQATLGLCGGAIQAVFNKNSSPSRSYGKIHGPNWDSQYPWTYSLRLIAMLISIHHCAQ
jgi:hypothetical protein